MTDDFSNGIGFGLFISIAVIMVIVNIIFFFKMWGMTNNVNEIKELLKEWLDLEHPVIEEPQPIKTKKD